MKTKTRESWTLYELEPNGAGERRWSVGLAGPRAYLTCDKETAVLISAAPEMLAALMEIEKFLDVGLDGMKASILTKDAIAKAMGG